MTDNDQPSQPRKKGRPAGKRGTFSFRVTASLRSQLDAAAAASERPVSEEIEHRLERSFKAEPQQALARLLLGGGPMSPLIDNLAEAARLIKAPTVSRSYEFERRAFLRAAEKIANHHLPNQPPFTVPIERTEEWERACLMADEWGDSVADLVLQQSFAALLEQQFAAHDPSSPTFEEPDLSGFIGMGGLMGAGAEEQARRRALETKALRESEEVGRNVDKTTENIRDTRVKGGKRKA